jgi:hypothetical protein
MTAPPLRKVNVADTHKGHAMQLFGLEKQIEEFKAAVTSPVVIAEYRLRPRIMKFTIFRRLIKLSCRIWKTNVVPIWRRQLERERH